MGPTASDRMGSAAAAARRCGVTRLGEITHLDSLGVPVFQAIRPWSRALSVHQGKGLSCEDARLGALMEAVESACAEAFAGPVEIVAWRDLPPAERPADLGDFADLRARSLGPKEAVAWTPARRLLGGQTLWTPLHAVSLDFTRPPDDRLSRSSNGQAAHFSLAAATDTALLELIERDATATWFTLSPDERTVARVALQTIAYPWFDDLHDRMRAQGLRLVVYQLPAVVPYPVAVASLVDRDRLANRPGAYGVACHPSAEVALRKAVLEAVQSRLTLIAGARDDIYYAPAGRRRGMGLAPPPPLHGRLKDWGAVADADDGPAGGGDLAIAHALAARGYPDAAVIELSEPGAEVVVAKAFVPGLAAFDRSRRPP